MEEGSSSAEVVPSEAQGVKTEKDHDVPEALGSDISSDNENGSEEKSVTEGEKERKRIKRRRVSQKEISGILAGPEVKVEGMRRRKSLEQFEVEAHRRLTIAEKEQLLQALETVSVNNVEELCRRMPSVTPGILQQYFHGVMVRDHGPDHQPKESAPIQMWLQRAEDLVDDGHDYSEVLPEVFRALQLFELRHRLPPECANTTSLYNYLVALLLGNKPPELGPAEACVMLQLMDCLANTLRSLDTASMVPLLRERYDVMGRILGSRSVLGELVQACTLENGELLGELMQEEEAPPPKKGKKGNKSGKQPTPTKQSSQANAGTETSSEQDKDQEKKQTLADGTPIQPPDDAQGGEGKTGKSPVDSASTRRSGRKAQAPARFTAVEPEAKKARFVKTPLFALNPFCFSPREVMFGSSTDAASSLPGPKQPKPRTKKKTP